MAGSKAGVKVDGVAETRRAFRRAADNAGDIGEGDREAARIVERDAVRRVPVRSGDLRGTIRTVALDGGGAAVVAGSSTVPYAGVINFGWRERGIEAQRFLDDRRADEVVEHYEDEVRDLVRTFGRDAP